ncbi:gliding motility-associated peptidyl-prolyl isomerase GldI [uncultured Croceitalea sp.]|uniref:gliding motility-associated peptidyl-prolyl isomerase GldI n=1 Tax=uncultured Croceitalea sp. TaxID=1798908 RepID=UPI003305A852
MKYLNFILILLLFAGCEGPKPRKPVQVKSKSFYKESIERSKKLLAQEQELIQNIIKNDSTREYFDSPYGFSYFYEVENQSSTYQLKTDDEVVLTYTMMTMNNDTLYTAEEIGVVQHAIDKSQLFSGLRNGIKLMKQFDKVTFLFPSSQGYGYKGDGNKIKPSTPLKTSVELLRVVQNKDSLNLK